MTYSQAATFYSKLMINLFVTDFLCWPAHFLKMAGRKWTGNTQLWLIRNRQQRFFGENFWGLSLKQPSRDQAGSPRLTACQRYFLVIHIQWKSLLFLPWYQHSLWTVRKCLSIEISRERLFTVTLQRSMIFCFWDLLILQWENTMKRQKNSTDASQIVRFFSPQ